MKTLMPLLILLAGAPIEPCDLHVYEKGDPVPQDIERVDNPTNSRYKLAFDTEVIVFEYDGMCRLIPTHENFLSIMYLTGGEGIVLKGGPTVMYRSASDFGVGNWWARSF